VKVRKANLEAETGQLRSLLQSGRTYAPRHVGSTHGHAIVSSFCVDCCWFLMALLFVGGVMNPLWIAAIAVYVALEKLLPAGPWLGRTIGAAIAAIGAFVLVRAM